MGGWLHPPHIRLALTLIGDRDKRWYDTTSEEMFIVINMLMARNKKLELREYWTTDP